jgi:hypothetical protein
MMEASAQPEHRYPALRTIAFVLRILALVTLIGGALITILATIEVAGSSGAGEAIVTAVGAAILTVFYFIVTLAFAELVELAVAVEANTRQAATR